jgi:hypothetical protein
VNGIWIVSVAEKLTIIVENPVFENISKKYSPEYGANNPKLIISFGA